MSTPNTASTTYDGDFSKEYITRMVPRVVAETDSMEYVFTYWQREIEYKAANIGLRRALPLNSKDPRKLGAYLIEDGAPRQLDNGILEWDRVFANVPKQTVKYETYSHRYQFITTDTPAKVVEAPKTVTSRVIRTFKFTRNPIADLPVLKAYRAYTLGSLIYFEGTNPGPGATWILAEDETLENWRGLANFYVRTRREVPQ